MKNNRDIYGAVLLVGMVILYLVVVNFVILIMYETPMHRYEISIYTPPIAWALIILAKSCLLILFIYYYQKSRSSLTLLIIINIVIMTIITLYAPYIRGYIGWYGDHTTHIGYIKDIIKYGYIPEKEYLAFGKLGNFYPLLHVLVSEILVVSNISILLGNYVIPTYSLLYVIGVFVLFRRIFKDNLLAVIPFLLTSLFVFNDYEIYLRPNAIAYLLLPLILYIIIYSSQNKKFVLMAFLFLFMLPFLHPNTAFLVGISILISRILSLTKIKSNLNTSTVNQQTPTILSIIFVISFSIWMTSNIGIGLTNRMFFWLLSSHLRYSSGLSSIANTAKRVHFGVLDIAKMALKIYGEEVIVIFLSLGSIYIAYKIGIKEYKKELSNIPLLLWVFMLVSLVGYFLYLLIPSKLFQELFGERTFRYLIVVLSGFAASTIKFIFKDNKQKRSVKYLARITTAVLLIIGIVNNTFAMYKSPYTLYPNIGIGPQEGIGYSWVIRNSPNPIDYTRILTNPIRYYNLICGILCTVQKRIISPPQLPDHFVYNNRLILCQQHMVYLVIPPIDRLAYLTVWKIVGRFNVEDFKKLHADQCTLKVYTSGGFDAWIIGKSSL